MIRKPEQSPEYKLDRLFSYALWYTGKYRVSRSKLIQKLRGKSTNETFIEQVLEQIAPYHSDLVEIRSHIDACLARAKPLSYVVSSLRQKWFISEEVKSILAEYDAFDAYENFERIIEKRFQQLIERRNGPKSISQDLLQKYPQFRSQIEAKCWDIEESELLAQSYSELPQWPKELKKYQDTLLRKGFSYSSIRSHIQNHSRGNDREN